VERELMALKLRQNPQQPFRSASELALAASLGWRLDVNRASASDWERLPGLTGKHRDLLLRLQAGGVQLSGAEDLQRLLEVSDGLLQAWLPVLEFRWYGAPAPVAEPERLDLNRASAAQLQGLGLTPERIQRLQRERLRQPFQDLADLQQRLQLPAALMEQWIGRVCFGNGPVGPVLPPGPKR
jgi:DNA uptake protein ComE-like DNA-binding protein